MVRKQTKIVIKTIVVSTAGVLEGCVVLSERSRTEHFSRLLLELAQAGLRFFCYRFGLMGYFL